ncbi:hypothetical protein OQJ02_09170 [Legionella sp. PATHC032]|uniref:hypothetical protein n=1 Tax=Legionella sp. PATHC032 TaxID=2992039 RepID=UPI001B2DD53C|nr:hypothetical protein [Legionella sp. PATHC032]MCW8421801.1 hypothetical protein [Legionella sp. PATHC032]HAZ7574284.1 hypothetical protein [Legionella pneumophila]HBA1636442.1 hypothetical protein [Legionella pneumophila]
MPISIRIEDSIHCIEVPNEEDLTLAQVRQKVAEKLQIQISDLESIHIDISSAKKNIGISEYNQKLKLREDYGLNESAVIKVRVSIKPMLVEANIIKMEQAQNGLNTAIQTAQNNNAHVVITVGSCLQAQHDTNGNSLKKQQFPIEHLNLGDNDNELVYFIHIDPGFKKPIPSIKQLHETDDWVRSDNNSEDNPIRTYTHKSGKYVITTIAVPILNEKEQRAYFSAEPPVGSLLGVDLYKYKMTAVKLGTGFVTGNFYEENAKPVICVAPNPNKLSQEITNPNAL